MSGHNQTGIGLYQEWLRTIARHEYPVKSFLNGLITRLDSLSAQSPLPKLLDDGAKRITRYTKSMIRGSNEPVFAFLNLMDAHPPLQHTYAYDNTIHDVPNSWSSLGFDYWEIRRDGAIEKNTEDIQYFKAIYRTAIDYLDRVVTGLISDIHSITNCETTVIVTADHGEDLGDSPLDSSFGHTGSLSEGLLHVPLELYNPPQGYKSVYDNLVSHLDLAQLIMSIADESDCDISRTVAPAEIIGGLRMDQDWPLSEDEFQYWNRMIRCAYRNKTKVVWDSQGRVTEHQLNPKQASSEQVVDELSSVPTYAQNLFEHDIENYKRHAREMETSFDRIDESTRDRLEELGYI